MKWNLNRYTGLIFLLLLFNSYSQVQELCEFIFTTCPKEFEGDTIRVPEKVIAMGSKVRSCEGYFSAEESGPPSIMFVIDNSGSMSGLGSSMNDRMGSRFSVPSALLDELYERMPDAEVGIAVFQNILYFDNRDDPFFVALPGSVDGVPNQSYAPLTKLNQQMGKGRQGIDKLKEVLATDTLRARLSDGIVSDYVRLRYVPGDTSKHTQYTNINVGFEAAKHAFTASSSARERRFIIFLSDGNPMGPMQAGMDPYYFQRGENVPTTFTVFFTSNNTAPQSLRTMTDNIRTNNYSVANPGSNLWTIETSHTALLSLIMNSMFGIIFSAQPQAMAVTGVSVSDTSTTFIDSFFVFKDRIPLQRIITPFNMNFTFSSIDPLDGRTRDTTLNIEFYVKRDSDVSDTAPPGIEYICWPQAQLQILHGGVPVQEVYDTMQTIQVRYISGDPEVSRVWATVSTSPDSEYVELNQHGQYRLSSPLTLERGGTGKSADGILGFNANDSIVAVFRNEQLPLDTVRVVVPIIPVADYIPVTATLRDTSGDGHIDRIDLSWTDTTKIRDLMPSVEALIRQLQITGTDGTLVSLHAIRLVPDLEKNIIHLVLRENAGSRMETGWNRAMVDLHTVAMGIDGKPFKVVRVIDAAGPAVMRAQLLLSSSASARDSLRLYFSEPVLCEKLLSATPDKVFVYYDKNEPSKDALKNSVFAGNCSGKYISEVTIVLSGDGFSITPWEDRIGFIGNGPYVEDRSGNAPHPGNRGAVIEGDKQNRVELAVSPSPGSPNREIDSRIRQVYGNVLGDERHGILVSLYSRIPLQPSANSTGRVTFGKAEIYDAVGNVVLKELPVIDTEEPGVYGIYWSIRNRNNRFVGNGTYLMIINATTLSGEKMNRRVKIGVQR